MSKNQSKDEYKEVSVNGINYGLRILRGRKLAELRSKYSSLFATDPVSGRQICRVAEYDEGSVDGLISIPKEIIVDGLTYFTACPMADHFSDWDNAMYYGHGTLTKKDFDEIHDADCPYYELIERTNTKETERIVISPSIALNDGWYEFKIDDIQWAEMRRLKSIDYIAPGNDKPTKSWRVVRFYGMKWLIELVGHTAQLMQDDYQGNIIIPGRIIYNGESYVVTSLNPHCFMGSHVSHVAIPSTIHRLPDFAYSHEPFTVSIPPNIVSFLPEMMFEYSKLTSITIPKSVQQIQDRCFNRCEELENVEMPDSINYIGDACFTGCKKLKSITIPRRVTYLGNICLWYCDSLEEIRCMVKVPPVPKSPKYGVMAWSEDFDKTKDDYMTFFKFHDPSAFDRIRLYVPRASVEAYKASKYWPFTNIIGI